MRIKGKVAVVTGSGSGIGRAIASLFATEGARVIVVDLIRQRADQTTRQIEQAGGEALAIEADVSVKRSVEAMVALILGTYGQIDILVNNAASVSGNSILEMDEDVWDQDVKAVLKTVFLCSKAILPVMKAQTRGSIVNISSINGLSAYGNMAYSAGKAGVINLTKNMAITYGQFNIRVNAICAATVHSGIWESRLQSHPDLMERLTKWYPLGRVGEPEDVAKATLFLASDDAAWITGSTLIVDGGLTAGNFAMSQELEAKA